MSELDFLESGGSLVLEKLVVARTLLQLGTLLMALLAGQLAKPVP